MKKIFIIIFVSLSFVFAQATNSKAQKIKHLLELTGSAKIGVQVVHNIIGSYKNYYLDIPQSTWDELLKEINADEIINLIIPIYDKYYTEQEIDELINFYKTPLGQKTIKVLPNITQESMAAGEKWGREIAEKINRKIKK